MGYAGCQIRIVRRTDICNGSGEVANHWTARGREWRTSVSSQAPGSEDETEIQLYPDVEPRPSRALKVILSSQTIFWEGAMSLIETLLERPINLCIASKYTAMNGIAYLSAGALLNLWPGAVQAILRDRSRDGRRRHRLALSVRGVRGAGKQWLRR